ncbi:MFS general substrate transporter [Nemania sp. FL0031]|nr:MFS general substrate transporter [Nemania sp. FL0031]
MKPEAEPNFNEQDVIAQLEKPPTITQAHHDSDSDTKLSNARENAILLLLTISQLVQILPLGIGINAGLEIGRRLGASSIQSTWVVASYPLTQGSFVLIGGRLGTIYGHKNVLVGGALWWTLWCALIGYADNLVAVSFLRGLCGIGGGLMIPNIIALIGINFPPGRKRNLGFALFGAMAPIGAAGGSLVGAVIIQLSAWKWAFFLVALLGAIVFGATAIAVLNDEPLDPNGSVDIVGSYLGVGGLVLFNFVWNQAPIVGWDNPYEIALLVVSVLHIAVFAYWESKVAKDPILPFNIWGVPSFGRLIICVALSFMSLGIFYWYMIVFMQTLRHDTLIQVAVQFLPLTIVGTTTPFLAAWMVPRLPAQVIIGIGCLAMVIINALLATIRPDLTYWAMCFPALFVSAFTIDLITTSAQIVISSTVPLKHQGVAGSLVGTLLGYGMSTGLGFAGTVEVHTFDNGRNLLRGYHSAAYLAVGMSAAALIISLLIRIPKNTQEGWLEDDLDAAERQGRAPMH